jgi:hypothetical protein
MSSFVTGPVLPAMSLVPASRTSTFGVVRQDVGTKADEHLWGRLAADVSIQIPPARKEPAAALVVPGVGNRVAQKDHRDRGAGAFHFFIGHPVTRQVRPVAKSHILCNQIAHCARDFGTVRHGRRRCRGGHGLRRWRLRPDGRMAVQGPQRRSKPAMSSASAPLLAIVVRGHSAGISRAANPPASTRSASSVSAAVTRIRRRITLVGRWDASRSS